MRRTLFTLSALALAGAALAGCSSSTTPDAPAATPSASESKEAVAGEDPVTWEPVTLNKANADTTIELTVGQTGIIEEAGDWLVASTDAGIVAADQGGMVGDAMYMSGIRALAPGSASVTAATETGDMLTWNITVVAGEGPQQTMVGTDPGTFSPIVMEEANAGESFSLVPEQAGIILPAVKGWTVTTSDDTVVTVTQPETTEQMELVGGIVAGAAGSATVTATGPDGTALEWSITVS